MPDVDLLRTMQTAVRTFMEHPDNWNSRRLAAFDVIMAGIEPLNREWAREVLAQAMAANEKRPNTSEGASDGD